MHLAGSGIESLEVGRIVAERNLTGGARVYCVGDRRRNGSPVGRHRGRQGRIQYVEQGKVHYPERRRHRHAYLRTHTPLGVRHQLSCARNLLRCEAVDRLHGVRRPVESYQVRVASLFLNQVPTNRRERSMSSPASSGRPRWPDSPTVRSCSRRARSRQNRRCEVSIDVGIQRTAVRVGEDLGACIDHLGSFAAAADSAAGDEVAILLFG